MKSHVLGAMSGCVLAITATLSNASTLFAANYDGIWEFDPSTGLGQNFTTIDAIALSYGDGYLFESDGNDISRYNVSLGTWAYLSDRNANVIAYGDGVLYTNNSGSGNGIIAIDAVTGTASTFNGLPGVTALAYQGTVIPIPPSVWLFGSGLLGLVGMARRKAA
jgi:hypothetical protein